MDSGATGDTDTLGSGFRRGRLPPRTIDSNGGSNKATTNSGNTRRAAATNKREASFPSKSMTQHTRHKSVKNAFRPAESRAAHNWFAPWDRGCPRPPEKADKRVRAPRGG